MNLKEFEDLLTLPESETLDFKRELYDFNLPDENGSAKLIKDIISFCNTPRNKSSYIIFGVNSMANGSKELKGLSNVLDDATFQDKIKGKVHPNPKFNFYPLVFEGKVFGIIEIPLHPYLKPLEPVKKMFGLEPNKIYFRRGSMNSEATPTEVMEIGHWLKELSNGRAVGMSSKNQLLKKILESDRLSKVIPDINEFAQLSNNVLLQKICKYELNGYYGEQRKDLEAMEAEIDYRVAEVFALLYKITNTGYGDATTLKRHLSADDNFHKINFLFPDPIFRLEEYYQSSRDNSSYASMQTDAAQVAPNMQGVPLHLYVFSDTFGKLQFNK